VPTVAGDLQPSRVRRMFSGTQYVLNVGVWRGETPAAETVCLAVQRAVHTADTHANPAACRYGRPLCLVHPCLQIRGWLRAGARSSRPAALCILHASAGQRVLGRQCCAERLQPMADPLQCILQSISECALGLGWQCAACLHYMCNLPPRYACVSLCWQPKRVAQWSAECVCTGACQARAVCSMQGLQGVG